MNIRNKLDSIMSEQHDNVLFQQNRNDLINIRSYEMDNRNDRRRTSSKE